MPNNVETLNAVKKHTRTGTKERNDYVKQIG